MSRTDVAIVGAGPAGSALAILLARQGIGVRLFDKERFPRDKVCGDFLSPRCLPLLAHLDVLDDVRREAGCRIEGMRLFSPGGIEVTGRYELLQAGCHGLGIERSRLDALLVEASRSAGCDVVLGTPVDPRSLDAALVVGADGRGSQVAQAFGIARSSRRGGGYALRAYLPAGPALQSLGEIHLTGWGYVGLGPVGRGRVNASIVIKDGRRRDLVDSLSALPTLRGKVTIGRAEAPRAAAPLSGRAARVVNGRALLVGDAALQLDPITGEGVYHALRTAVLAAEAIPQALSADRPSGALRRYARRHRSEFAERLAVSRALQALLRSRIACETAAVVLSRSPILAARLVGYLGNAAPVREGLVAR